MPTKKKPISRKIKKFSDVSKADIDLKKYKKVESYEKLKTHFLGADFPHSEKTFQKGKVYKLLPNGEYKEINILRVRCNNKVEIDIKLSFDALFETILFARVASSISHTLGNLVLSYSRKKSGS